MVGFERFQVPSLGPPVADYASMLSNIGKSFEDAYIRSRSRTQEDYFRDQARLHGGDTTAPGGVTIDTTPTGSTTPAPSGKPASFTILEGDNPTLSLLRKEEGFRDKPYWDVNAHRVGYGSDTVTDPATGTISRVTPGMTITRDMAEADLNRRVGEFQNGIRARVPGFDAMPEGTKAALTSIAYNYGSLPRDVVAAANSGDVNALRGAVAGLSSNPARRRREAALIGLGPTMTSPAAAGGPIPAASLRTAAPPGVTAALVTPGTNTTPQPGMATAAAPGTIPAASAPPPEQIERWKIIAANPNTPAPQREDALANLKRWAPAEITGSLPPATAAPAAAAAPGATLPAMAAGGPAMTLPPGAQPPPQPPAYTPPVPGADVAGLPPTSMAGAIARGAGGMPPVAPGQPALINPAPQPGGRTMELPPEAQPPVEPPAGPPAATAAPAATTPAPTPPGPPAASAAPPAATPTTGSITPAVAAAARAAGVHPDLLAAMAWNPHTAAQAAAIIAGREERATKAADTVQTPYGPMQWNPQTNRYDIPVAGTNPNALAVTLIRPEDKALRQQLGIPDSDTRIWKRTAKGDLEPVSEQRDPQTFEHMNTLATSFEGNKVIQEYRGMEQALAGLHAAFQQGNPQGDLVSVIQLFKAIDPNSTVSANEVATAENSGGVPAALRAMYNRALGQGKFSPETRGQFFNTALGLLEARQGQASRLADYYQRRAKLAGLKDDEIKGTISWEPAKFERAKADTYVERQLSGEPRSARRPGSATAAPASGAPPGSQQNPIPISSPAEAANLPKGTYVIHNGRPAVVE